MMSVRVLTYKMLILILLLLSSDGFVFLDGFVSVLVLYLLAAVYLDASPLPPYMGGSSKPFLGANAATLTREVGNIQEQGTH